MSFFGIVRGSKQLVRVDLTFIGFLIFTTACSRFGLDNLDQLNGSNLESTTLSSSLGTSLKADLTAAGIDTASSNIIADNAIYLSSSLEASLLFSFAEGQAELSESSNFAAVSAKFTEGAMAGIKLAVEAGMNTNLKGTAAGVNSYTPISSMNNLGRELSDDDKAAISESISSTAVANMQNAGFSTAELSSALQEISKKAVEAVAKSGVSAEKMTTMVQKASGGATKGLSTLLSNAEAAGDSTFTDYLESGLEDLTQDVAKGSVAGLSEVAKTPGSSAADLLTSVTTGLTEGLVSIQAENPDFDANKALDDVKEAASEQASQIDDFADLDPTTLINDATDNITLQVATPQPSLPAQQIYNDTGIEVTLTSSTPGTLICYSTGETLPACSTDKQTCINSDKYEPPLKFTTSTDLKAIACKAGLADSSMLSATYPRIANNVSIANIQTEGGKDVAFVQIDQKADGSMDLYFLEDMDNPSRAHGKPEVISWLTMKAGSYIIDSKKLTVLHVELTPINQWQTISFPADYAHKAVVLGNKISRNNDSSLSGYKRFSHLDIDYRFESGSHSLRVREEADGSETNIETAKEYASIFIFEEGVYRLGNGDTLWDARNIDIPPNDTWHKLNYTSENFNLIAQVSSENTSDLIRLDLKDDLKDDSPDYEGKLEGDNKAVINSTKKETVAALFINKNSIELPDSLTTASLTWSLANFGGSGNVNPPPIEVP